ncbi:MULTISPECIES: carbohydrate-binding module family 14 protein [Nocardia]|uniref:Chitin-binding type-2 domain-containing protein n=1 Tax=Nocardia arthritidis TaxID=228602 RepID=A0A6G9YB65_9NOCA|nr:MULTISPECIES: carbohydrate-binding module family 14 protein [Nocardia]QIS10370.1 hypothetical protein F5544_12395 [Nocardia arthritidis]
MKRTITAGLLAAGFLAAPAIAYAEPPIPWETTKPNAEAGCTDPGQRYAPGERFNEYWRCGRDGVAYLKNCDGGFLWDVRTDRCDWPQIAHPELFPPA